MGAVVAIGAALALLVGACGGPESMTIPTLDKIPAAVWLVVSDAEADERIAWRCSGTLAEMECDPVEMEIGASVDLGFKVSLPLLGELSLTVEADAEPGAASLRISPVVPLVDLPIVDISTGDE